jgi:hypothetical protein
MQNLAVGGDHVDRLDIERAHASPGIAVHPEPAPEQKATQSHTAAMAGRKGKFMGGQ